MANPPYAHTLLERPQEEWEPLFSAFGDGADECQRGICLKCQNLEPDHGHLNKVAWWTAKFASEMFNPLLQYILPPWADHSAKRIY